MTTGLPLMKSVLASSAKIVLLPIELSSGMSAADAAIQNTIYGSGTTALAISNEEIEDIRKIVKSLEKSWLLVKGISETIKNEAKEQKRGFFPMLLGTLVEISWTLSRNKLSKIKDGLYLINLDGYESIGIHWIALHVDVKNVLYFDSFGVEHIPKEIRKFIGNKNIITNIYKIQAFDSIMCGYFCTFVLDF